MKKLIVIFAALSLGHGSYASEAATSLKNPKFNSAGVYTFAWYKPAMSIHAACWLFSNNVAFKQTENKNCYGTGEKIGWLKDRFATSYICARYIQFNANPDSLYSIEQLSDQTCMGQTQKVN